MTSRHAFLGLMALFSFDLCHSTAAVEHIDKLTYHNDPQRSGWNSRESRLTPQSVSGSSFGRLWSTGQLDFADGKPPRLFATPLYVHRIQMRTGPYKERTLSVLYAVTTAGYVYAVNAFAQGKAPPGAILWRARLTEHPCAKGTMGNLSTPVINLAQQRIYVTSCDDAAHWRAHALDIRTGAPIANWPVNINAAALNETGINRNGPAKFPEGPEYKHYQRGALNLSVDGQRLYITFGKEYGPGWIVVLDTRLAKVATAFSATAVAEENQGGMWASGGPAIDRQGRIYIATGARWTPDVFADSAGNWGQSILQFTDDAAKGISLSGTYTPFNYCQAMAAQYDLGSSGTTLIDLDPAKTSTPQLLVLGGAKQGNVYLLDRARMPGSLTKRQPCSTDSASDQSLLAPDNQPQFGKRGPINVFGPYSEEHGSLDNAKSRTTPAYFRDATGTPYVFVTGSSKSPADLLTPVPPGLVRLKIVMSAGQPAYLQADQSENTQTFVNPGSAIITSDGSQNAIVWVLDENAPRSAELHGPKAPQPVLYAFDAMNLKLLWKSAPGDLSTSGKYNEPTVVNGVVFFGTDRIEAFGLQPSPAERKPSAPREFTPLFDGKTLAHWRGDPKLWSVVDGAITGRSVEPNKISTFLIHDGKFRNFELRLRYRFLTPQGNSGIQYRSRMHTDHAYSVAGYQANVITPDTPAGYDAKENFSKLYDENARGLLANTGEQVVIRHQPKGIERRIVGSVNAPSDIRATARAYPAWNDYIVIAYEDHLVHVINGFVTVDARDEDVDGRAMEGFFAFQLHAGPPMGVQFRDIEVKTLTAEPDINGRFVSRPASSAPMPTLSGSGASVSLGQRVYEQRCAPCHSSGQPGVPTAASLTVLSPSLIVQTLTSGSMKPMAAGLSSAEIEALAAYLTSSPQKP